MIGDQISKLNAFIEILKTLKNNFPFYFLKEIIGHDSLKRKVIIRKIGNKFKRSLSKVNFSTINSKLLSSPEQLRTFDDTFKKSEDMIFKSDEKNKRNSSFSSKFSDQHTPNNLKKKLSDKQLIQSLAYSGSK